MASGQQYQLSSGQQPPGHVVSSGPHCLILAIFTSWVVLASKGQSAAVGAQTVTSSQQNQLASGQQPPPPVAKQLVSSGSHCLIFAIFTSGPLMMSLAILASSLQSAEVGAQFMLSAQQNQLG